MMKTAKEYENVKKINRNDASETKFDKTTSLIHSYQNMLSMSRDLKVMIK